MKTVQSILGKAKVSCITFSQTDYSKTLRYVSPHHEYHTLFCCSVCSVTSAAVDSSGRC